MQNQNTNIQNNTFQGTAPSAAGLAAARAEKAATAAESALSPVSNNPVMTDNIAKNAAAPKPVSAAPKSKATKSATTKSAAMPGPKAIGLPSNDYVKRIANKIRDSENILVALSRDPSVDELAAAIGLTMFLDGLQKHTTAIYSGQAPDALKFLQPEGTFETNTDSLQDFIIALSKEKADHLRYKLEGDFVKVYITPYKTILTEDDLEFSHGDFNVDLVLALGVPTADDLDEALSEHGRIMHDATTVDITCDAPGKFAEIEWSDPGVSSVSEMVTKLIFALQDNSDEPLDKEVATALLTGIVASTERFSNGRTTSETMQLASKLMSMGADQQLIAAHVMDNNPSGNAVPEPEVAESLSTPESESSLLVGQDYGVSGASVPDLTETVVPADVPTTPLEQSTAMAQADAGLQSAESGNAVNATSGTVDSALSDAVSNAVANAAAVGATGVGVEPVLPTVQPVNMANSQPVAEGPKDYAAMLQQALTEPGLTAAENAGIVPNINSAMPAGAPVVSVGGAVAGAQPDVMNSSMQGAPTVNPEIPNVPVANPAMAATPVEPVNGELAANPGVVLPPPPAPEVSADMMPPVLPQVQIPPELVN